MHMDPTCPSPGDGSPTRALAALQRHISRQSSRSQSPVAPQLTATGVPYNAAFQRQLRSERMQTLTSDLAELRAAIHKDSNPTQEPLRQPQCPTSSNTQHRDINSNLQQLRHNTSLQQLQAATAPAAGAADKLDLSKVAEQLQERSGRLSSLLTKQQEIDARLLSTRPSFSRQGREGVGGSSIGQDLQQAAAADGSRPGSNHTFARASSPLQQADVVPALQSQLAALQERMKAATRAVAVSASGTNSSRNSSMEQPPTPALAAQAVAVTAQELAKAGMTQLQEVTQLGQHMRQLNSTVSSYAAEVESRLLGLDSFFRQHPEFHSAAALQRLVEANKQLRQDLFAKQQSLTATLHALREQTHTPADKRSTVLQQELEHLRMQLLTRDAALAAAEEENRHLRQQFGVHESQGGGSDFSPSPCKVLIDGHSPGSYRAASPDVSRRLNFNAAEALCDSLRSSRSSRGSGDDAQQRRQQQQVDVSAAMYSKLSASYQAALDAKDLQVQQLQQQVADLQAKQEALQHRKGASPVAVQQQLRKLAKPRTLDEAIQQITSLNDIVTTLQQQMTEQDRLAKTRAAEREQAFRRQLQVEKQQHEYTKQNCKLMMEQLEQLQERLAKSQAQVLQLQQQLEQAQEKVQEAALAAGSGVAGRRSEVDHIQRLQQHVQDQKQQIAQLQSCVQGVQGLLRTAGKLVSPAAAQDRQLEGLAQQLQDSIKQLILEASKASVSSRSSSAATATQAVTAADPKPQQQQQQEVQGLEQQLLELEQENEQLRQDVDELVAYRVQTEQELEQNARRLQQSEQLLAGMMQMQDRNKQLQQDLADTRAQLDRALQDQQCSAVHLEQCRQQLAEVRRQMEDCAAERDSLMERIRELADRASAAETAARAGPASAAAAEVLQQQMSQACSDLSQQVLGLQKQLGDSQAKEERVQVANAQLQERNAQLQEQISKLQVSADTAALHAEHSHQQLQAQQQILTLQQQANQQQQHILELQQQLQQREQQQQDAEQLLQQQEQQVQDLQQQLEQTQQVLQEVQEVLQQAQQQQQQPESAADGDLAAEVEQLRLELDDRTKELEEWQIHADALEKDLDDLKVRVEMTDGLQQQLEQQQHMVAALEADKQQLQQELANTRNRVSHLEFDLHDASKDHSALLARFEAVSAELARVKDAAADMRLRLEHFTGPAGPQARMKQLEAALQSMQRKYESADNRAAQAAAQIQDLEDKLGKAEDEVLSLEGQISILETELAKYTS